MSAKRAAARSGRGRRRFEKPVVVIACEGETEYRYFCDVRRRFRASWIVPHLPHSNDPMGIVDAARRKGRELKKEGLDVRLWAVFDAESRMAQAERKYAEAITYAHKNGVETAQSSPCFEYWILLHYAPGIMVDEPREAERELGRPDRVQGYRKPALPYDELWQLYLSGGPSCAAVARRDAVIADGDDPLVARPVTYVDTLMDRLTCIQRS